MTPWRSGWLALLLAVLISPGLTRPAEAGEEAVRIGLVQTMFKDVPEFMVRLAVRPFTELVKEHTGLTPKLIVGGDAFELGRKLHSDEIDLAVFHGIEMAWAQHKYGDLRPLVIAVNKFGQLRANVVVRADHDAATLVSLKGKNLAIPLQTKEHCRVFLEHNCAGCSQCNSRSFFKQISNPTDHEEALDELVQGKVQAVLVDDWGLEDYKYNKPSRSARLKVLKKSEDFPTGVIAFRTGALSDATLQRFRTGMGKASSSPRGREMMNWWRIREFQEVSPAYIQQLTDILKAYPPPESLTSTNTQN